MVPARGDLTERRWHSGCLERLRFELRIMVKLRLDRRIFGRVDAEDVVQDGCLEALKKLGYYCKRPVVRPYVWLRGVVREKLLHAVRRHIDAKIRSVDSEIPLYLLAFADSTVSAMSKRLLDRSLSPGSEAIRREHLGLLNQALGTMDPIDREILLLRHIEEMGNMESAEELGFQVLPQASGICERESRLPPRGNYCATSSAADGGNRPPVTCDQAVASESPQMSVKPCPSVPSTG